MHRATRHVARIALGFALLGSAACGSGLTPALVECKLNALRVLPEDPNQATVADARDVIGRLKACHAQADGGAQ
jgi:hypothetical protein